jgi:hypothetical protein
MKKNTWFNRLIISYVIISAPVLIIALFLSGVSLYKSYEVTGVISRAADEKEITYENVKLKGYSARFVDGYQSCMDDKRNFPVYRQYYKTSRMWIIEDYFEKKECKGN